MTGATSTLGSWIAREFARNGCTIICVDGENDEKLEEIKKELASKYPSVMEIRSKGRKGNESMKKPKVLARSFACDLWDRNALRDLARKVEIEVGPIDVLVTCAGHSGQDIFDTVNFTLMSHYWVCYFFFVILFRNLFSYF